MECGACGRRFSYGPVLLANMECGACWRRFSYGPVLFGNNEDALDEKFARILCPKTYAAQ